MNLRTGTTRDGRFFCVAESDKHRVWAHGKTEKSALELAFAVCARVVKPPGDYIVSMYGEILPVNGNPHEQIRGGR